MSPIVWDEANERIVNAIPALHELAHQHDLHVELFDEPRPSIFQRIDAWFRSL